MKQTLREKRTTAVRNDVTEKTGSILPLPCETLCIIITKWESYDLTQRKDRDT